MYNLRQQSASVRGYPRDLPIPPHEKIAYDQSADSSESLL